jgi:hypothetical protein
VPGSDVLLGPVGVADNSTDPAAESEDEEEEGAESEGNVDVRFSLVGTEPLQSDITIDQPVTSGNDMPGQPD